MKLQALIAAFGCANHNNTLIFFFFKYKGYGQSGSFQL